MEYIKKEELKDGDVFVSQMSHNHFLNKYGTGYSLHLNLDNTIKNQVLYRGGGFAYNNMRLATSEEKHWLNCCITADKFITFEEAMKTFIPEYVECIKALAGITIGKILPVKNNMIIDGTFNNYSIKANDIYNYFKPSTKEACDAQFVVKEPEFVLPEIWWVRITKENLKDISKFLDFNLGEYTIGFVAGMIKSYKIGKITKGYNSTPTTSYGSTFGNEITYDQFKQYRLKENTTVTEEPKVVLEEPKDKVLQRIDLLGKGITIGQVQCSEGGVYKIGDKITVFDKYSPNKGKPFIIKSFRWSNDKSKICAVTELHTPNGIGLDKIELYIKPKVKDDFVLPENWYIKVTDDNKEVLQQYILNIHNLTMITVSNINYLAYSKWLTGINRTENKLGYGLISKLNLNPLPNIYRTVTYYNGVEITFEQFKKYVLKDE